MTGLHASQLGASGAIFLGQIVVLLLTGRLLGELVSRLGQPPVMGQLLAGIVLGPSILGHIAPGAEVALFPDLPQQRAMLEAVAQLGVLLLLLLTGMETDLSVMRHSGRAAVSVSLAGIAVPFLCGLAAIELLPAPMLARPDQRLLLALFIGTALAISSVKIVAALVRELGFIRRTVGQIILAAAIIDDAIGWIFVSVLLGLAQRGSIDVGGVARSVLGTLAFLAFSITLGRRLVFHVIRWTNDHFVSELPVITVILVIMGVMALTTNAIGVQTVLGAFVAGILIGESPILTRHIEEQLRGLIVALFMPVFFGLAGLATNVAALGRPNMLLLTAGLIAVASIGKFSGAALGGRLAGLTGRESLAVGSGMNARGSTEVIIASIGLSMGLINESFFTAIVVMAVVTTLAMPPMLRWSLQRLPMRPEEASRLERESLEARGFLSGVERLLLAADASPSGQLASRLAGIIAGVRQIPATALHFEHAIAEGAAAEHTTAVIREAAESGGAENGGPRPLDLTLRVEEPRRDEDPIRSEDRKGYGLLLIGREPASRGARFNRAIAKTAAGFSGPFAVVLARREHRSGRLRAPLNILVPVSGTSVSRRGAELAVALAQGSRGSVTALHIAGRTAARNPLRSRLGALFGRQDDEIEGPSNNPITNEIVQLARAYSVNVRSAVRSHREADTAILREIGRGRHDVLVMGVSPRPGDDPLNFGDVASVLLERAECSLVFLAAEPAAKPEPPANPK
ncbi:MAG TPA: cation:proton antiporter [Steroidobacteraceae bacterium]|jgi:Kef-type K+ transport system membrane component KefB/nucleotide-binding universal stress UspA family protein|nr:cation:proton antiporter [Steroidobacteraceae bacterium]